MSDHWKKLANLLGTPGPADPPETAETTAANEPSTAKETAPIAAARPPEPAAAAHTSGAQAARKRSSMWGDDLESEPVTSQVAPQQRGSTAAPTPPQTQAQPPVDALDAIVDVKREPAVPGFEVPEGQSPERAQSPPKRSAWDTLIGTLGIKPVADPDAEQPQAAAPAAKEAERKDLREPAGASDFGAGLVDTEDRPRAPRESSSRESSSRDLGPREPSSARRAPDAGAARSADDDEDRPRVRGRRGGSRTRSRGADTPRESEFGPASDIGWDPEPVAGDEPQRAPADQPEPDRPRRSAERPAGDVRGEAFRSEEGEGETRRRRSRRRGQRQTLSVSDVEGGRVAREPASSREESGAPPRDDVDAPRREDTGSRDRRPRGERAEETRSGRSTRSRRPEEGRRGEPRGGRGRPDAGEPEVSEDEVVEGFGEGLLAEIDSSSGGEEDVRSRPRRRRGRRGRGGAGPREDDSPRSEEVSEPDDTWAPVSAAPEFDDDYEDDDEAEQIRRRSRSGRSRPARRDVVASDRGEGTQEAGGPPTRSGDRDVAAKHYSAPTWLDTVTLLVDANIQRRASGGGGSARGSQGGRGGRR